MSAAVENFEKVVINVSGRRFQTWRSTLRKHPNTLLGSDLLTYFYDRSKKEYFLDRDPVVFRHILRYYQVGKLHLSYEDCMESFCEELKFYGISVNALHECCWADCVEKSATIVRSRDETCHPKQPLRPSNQCGKLRAKIYDLLESGAETRPARIVRYSIGVLICLSVLCALLASIPCEDERTWEQCYYQVFEVFDWIFLLVFTTEYLLRLFTAPNFWKFVKDKLNLVDLAAIVPFYIDISMRWFFDAESVRNTAYLDIFRLFRGVRIVKLARHSTYMRKFGRRLKKALSDLGFLYFAFFMGNIFFSCLVYSLEKIRGFDTFDDIPESMWYTMVTMMSLGYGDIVPRSVMGKIVGAFSCLCGIIFLALPMPLLQDT